MSPTRCERDSLSEQRISIRREPLVANRSRCRSIRLQMRTPRQPAWMRDPDAPPAVHELSELNLDCGNKKSIAASVASSPQRLSNAFRSQIPRFDDPRQVGLLPCSPAIFYFGPDQHPHVDVKDPARQNVCFKSTVARFPSDGHTMRGMHPATQQPQVCSPSSRLRRPQNMPTILTLTRISFVVTAFLCGGQKPICLSRPSALDKCRVLPSSWTSSACSTATNHSSTRAHRRWQRRR